MTSKNFLLRLDKFLSLVLLLSVFCLIFIFSHRAIFDADIWLHLKSGELILKNKFIPSQDTFSFTLQGKPWIDHEWLFQTLAYFIYSHWQAEGLILLESYCLVLTFFILFLMGMRTMKSYMEVAVAVLLTVYACVGRFNIRPDIFSLLLFSLYLYLLRFQIKEKKLWLLVPIQVLWVNLHGYFFLGPLVTLLFVLAEALRRKLKFLPLAWKKEFILDDNDYRRLIKILFFIVLACLVNPRGLTGASYPLNIFKEIITGKTAIFFEHIQELQPTFGGKIFLGDAYFLIVIFCFSLMVINFRKIKLVEIFLAVFFFLFALRVRNVAFFAFIGFMIIASYAGTTINRISATIKLETRFRQLLPFLLKYGLIIFLIFYIGFKINAMARDGYYDFENKKFISLTFGIDGRRYPKAAVDFLLVNDIASDLFNDFNSGSYLVGTVYPKIKVFIDGRGELYGGEFFKRYQEMMQGNPKAIETIVNKYNISAVLLSLSGGSLLNLMSYLYKNQQWKLVFFDARGLVFLKDISKNKEPIKKYHVDFKTYQVPAADLQNLGLRNAYPGSYIKRASLFNLFNEDELVIAEAKEALRIMPNCAEAFHLIGKVYLRQGLYRQSLENLRAALLFIPRNVEAWVNLGSCLKELKDYKSALRALKGAISFNQRYAPAYYELGGLYLIENNLPEALKTLDKATKYAPLEPRYQLRLGEALIESGRKSNSSVYRFRAKKALNRASELNIQGDADLEKKIQEKLVDAEGTR